MAVVRIKDGIYDKYGYINKTGKIVIDFKFNLADDFKNGSAYVKIDDKTYLINKNGDIMQELK